MVVVCERLVAIKFTFSYLYIVTKRNIMSAVSVCWIYIISCEIARELIDLGNALLVAPVVVSCVVFVFFSYMFLYKETLRHQKMFKRQHLPEEVERFLEDSKALKTTVLVVSAVVLCLISSGFAVVLRGFGVDVFSFSVKSVFRTSIMLNSLLNPMI